MAKPRILSSGEWDLLAVVAASIIGIIAHVLELIPEGYVISLILLLLALHALHEIGHDMRFQEANEALLSMERRLTGIEPEVKVITGDHFKHGEDLARRNRGTFVWFNTPMTVMRSQEVFDLMLKPAIESESTRRVEFILRPEQKEFFDSFVWPKVQRCRGREKVAYPSFVPIKENFAFKMIDASEGGEAKEFHLTFLDAPFTITREAEDGSRVVHPKIIFHVLPKSELAKELREVYLKYVG
jgi:hypothetical protein